MTAIMTSFGFLRHFSLPQIRVSIYWWQYTQEKECQNVPSLLQQCEEMLGSITDKKLLKDKESLLVKFAHYYVETDHERSYQLAQLLTSPDHIFEAALSLKNAEFPDIERLDALFMQAFNKLAEKQSTGFSWLLPFAKAFSPNHPQFDGFLAGCAFSVDHFLEQPDIKKFPVFKFRAYCQIAQCHRERGALNPAKNLLNQAQNELHQAQYEHIKSKLSNADEIEARLLLADAFFSIQDFVNMVQELYDVHWLIKKDRTAENVYSRAKLQNKIRHHAKIFLDFNNVDVEKLIDTTLQDLAINLSDENRAEDCLTLASIYREGLLEESDTKQNLLDKAFEYNNRLRGNTLHGNTKEEIYSKIAILERLSSFYEGNSDAFCKVVLEMECVYYSYGIDQPTPSFRKHQAEIGSKILKIYNKAGLQDKSNNFFQQYLANLKDTAAHPETIIGQLVAFAEHIDHGGYLTTEQVEAQLKAAEELLPQLHPLISYEGILALIAEGYSQINPQKSLELLANYQNKKAKSCVIPAIAPPILTGIMSFYPGTGLLLSGAYVVTRWKGLF